jgi:carboxymethylenebutenolidase
MRITLPSSTPAELAIPDGRARRGVVVSPDIMGLRPLFDGLCERLAGEQGWAVCAPEPWPGRGSLTLDERQAAVVGLVDRQQVGDLVAAADLLAERAAVSSVAVLGFCMGGMYALKAATTARFDRVVSFYGMIRLPEHWRGAGQAEPIDLLAGLAAPMPVMAIVGGHDSYTPAADVDDLERLGATVVRYPEADHGFVHDPDRPAHRADDAADAWRRVVAFLAVERGARGGLERELSGPGG